MPGVTFETPVAAMIDGQLPRPRELNEAFGLGIVRRNILQALETHVSHLQRDPAGPAGLMDRGAPAKPAGAAVKAGAVDGGVVVVGGVDALIYADAQAVSVLVGQSVCLAHPDVVAYAVLLRL